MPKGHYLSDVDKAKIIKGLGTYDHDAALARQMGIGVEAIRGLARHWKITRTREGAVTKPTAAIEWADRLLVNANPEPKTNGESSLKTDMLRVLAETGPYDDVEALCKQLRGPGHPVGVHEATHVLVALSKQGLAKMIESKATGAITYSRIRATRQAYDLLGYPAPHVPVTNNVVARAGRIATPGDLNRPHPGDPTDYRNQPGVAPGGPITRSHVEPAPAHGTPPAPPVAPVQPKADDSLPVTTAGYPAIEALIARSDRLRRAAELLEAAGQDDLALATLSKVDDVSPLEREVIEFFRRFNDRAR